MTMKLILFYKILLFSQTDDEGIHIKDFDYIVSII